MGDKSKGWIRLHRSVMDCFIYDGYAFDYYHAWCDILLNSNHKDKGIMFDGQLITIKRGQWLTSIRKLSNRWGWSKDKVSRYLNTLVENQMITKDCDKKRTLLTLVNYDFYQTDTDTEQDSDRTLTGHTPDTDKDTDRTKQECKNEKNDKNVKIHTRTSSRKPGQYILVERIRRWLIRHTPLALNRGGVMNS